MQTRQGIHPTVREAVETICKFTNTRVPTSWETLTCPCDEPNCGHDIGDTDDMCGVAEYGGHLRLICGTRFHEFPTDELWGVATHEVGHIANGDVTRDRFTSARFVHMITGDPEKALAALVVENYDREHKADAFAKKHGMGPALAKALERHLDTDEPNPEHPPVTERIRRLRS